MKISPVGAKMLQAGGQTDGRTDMTNVIVDFSSFAKVPKIQTHARTHARTHALIIPIRGYGVIRLHLSFIVISLSVTIIFYFFNYFDYQYYCMLSLSHKRKYLFLSNDIIYIENLHYCDYRMNIFIPVYHVGRKAMEVDSFPTIKIFEH
jgi:hypothetical protein